MAGKPASFNMNTNHTPGPWHAVEYAGYWQIQTSENYDDDHIQVLDVESTESAPANAALCAAAPEMLEVLQMVAEMLEPLRHDIAYFTKEEEGRILYVIKKAIGQ
jgi:Na+/phosphate symporter